MMVGVVISLAIAAVGALILMRLGRLDAKTAALATMPGGVIEMANVAERVDADPLPILVLQTMRVGLDRLRRAVPGHVAGGGRRAQRRDAGRGDVLADRARADGACRSSAALLLNRFTLPNAWFLGSLLTMAALGALGLIPGRVPEPILIVAQVIIGVSIGTQYKHEFLTRLLRLFLSSLVTVPFALVMLALVAARLFRRARPAGDDAGAGARAGRHRGNGAHRQGARPRRRADHRLPDRAHRLTMVAAACGAALEWYVPRCSSGHASSAALALESLR